LDLAIFHLWESTIRKEIGECHIMYMDVAQVFRCPQCSTSIEYDLSTILVDGVHIPNIRVGKNNIELIRLPMAIINERGNHDYTLRELIDVSGKTIWDESKKEKWVWDESNLVLPVNHYKSPKCSCGTEVIRYLYAVSMVTGAHDEKGHSIVMQIDQDIKERNVQFAPVAVLAVNKNGAIDVVNFLKQVPKDAQASYTADSDLITPEDFNSQGESHYSKQEYGLAITYFTKAIELDPHYAIAYHNRGNALREYGVYGLAILDFDTVIKSNNYANAYLGRGLVYLDECQYDLSITDFNRAISIDSNCARAYYERSNAYYEKGDLDLSLLDLYKVVETSTDDYLIKLASDAIMRLKTG